MNHFFAIQAAREALQNPRGDALVRIGIGHKALFAANSTAIGKKSNAVDCPSLRPRRPQGVMQRFPRSLSDLEIVGCKSTAAVHF